MRVFEVAKNIHGKDDMSIYQLRARCNLMENKIFCRGIARNLMEFPFRHYCKEQVLGSCVGFSAY